MTITRESTGTKQAVYSLEGTLLEVCSCGVLCPCWVGEDPDGGECWAFLSHNFTSGQIKGIDVSGLSLVSAVHIPGNVLTPKSWKMALFIDEKASPEQKDAIVAAFTGELGGPLADMAGFIGEVATISSAPIRHELENGHGVVSIPGKVEAELDPFRGPDGSITTLRDSVFSTVPGSPAWAAKAKRSMVNLPEYGMKWEFEGRNAIQSEWKMEHTAA